MPSITIKWVAVLDAHTCPICRSLHGYEWTFTTPEPMGDILAHPQVGVVWSFGVGSQAHGHQQYNCRCTILLEKVDFSDVNLFLEKTLAELEAQAT